MADSTKALTAQRIHEIKAKFHSGATQQEVVAEFAHRWPVSPKELDALIAIACEEMDSARLDTEHRNREFVMNELRSVYYRACAKEDLGAQVTALGKIGQFCGLSEKNPYRGKFLNPETYTEEEYDEALRN